MLKEMIRDYRSYAFFPKIASSKEIIYFIKSILVQIGFIRDREIATWVIYKLAI
jgi:hypothetical protein